ncbi:ATP synthase f chain, mitochondrial precursor [Malassezia cuniculi]|uniref:ATP synthase f chain, mitochondrial n=1 Tax=Malassezia cuniculi TaxID=948313 RepID=A0AAF0J7T3_9BASI|nr:ATP synthase f chain, mitochondrial precursor [Malassezia cuniculi]
MIARIPQQTRMLRVAGQQVRHASGLPIPPKIATPKSVSGGSGTSSSTEAVVNFYKSLPKGPAPEKRAVGIKAKYFDGKNASGKPILATIGALLLIGYTIEYNGHLKYHKNAHH